MIINKLPFARNLFSICLIAIVTGLTVGCGNQDSKSKIDTMATNQTHEALNDRIAHRGIILLKSPFRTSPVVRHRMGVFLDDYEFLREALEVGDITKAGRLAARMNEAVANVPTADLRDKGKRAWLQHANLYNQVLSQMRDASALPQKRSFFAHLSEIVYCTVKSFGLGDQLSYVYFCPMALEGNGAYWLAESEADRNPYFGSDMVGCIIKTETLGP